MRSLRLGCTVLIALILAPTTGTAQDDAPPPSCSTPEYRQFDFWIGTWDVFDPQGTQVGVNTIRAIYDGCVLEERWEASGPHRGGSFNMYDAPADTWHQSWVDNGGLLLQLDGGLVDGTMVLEGSRVSPQGNRMTHRISWTELEPGRVRQLWQVSPDGGATWSVAFDGTYVRRD
jgi:hypothetical protein